MTDMDWAETEARRLTAAWRPVADALRKAKADGMREAAELAEGWLTLFSEVSPHFVTPQKWANDAVKDIADNIRDAASKLQPPTE